VIVPYQHIVIDATCGNGKDTLALATFLFPHENENENQNAEDPRWPPLSASSSSSSSCQLIGIDIQEQACINTQQLLRDHLSSTIMEDHVCIVRASHAPLRPLIEQVLKTKNNTTNNNTTNTTTTTTTTGLPSIGLICYNLGYLPGSETKHTTTKMRTTLQSITDAAILLRPTTTTTATTTESSSKLEMGGGSGNGGGVLSILTYPGSNYLEYSAVAYFMEGLALFSSKEIEWHAYLRTAIPTDAELRIAASRRTTATTKSAEEEDGVAATAADTSTGDRTTTTMTDTTMDDEPASTTSVRDLVLLSLQRVRDADEEHTIGKSNPQQPQQTWRVFDHSPLGRPMSP
jgi:hypothetical protein